MNVLEQLNEQFPNSPECVRLKAALLYYGIRFDRLLAEAGEWAFPNFMPYHLPPGEGDTDFSTLTACFGPEILKILELRASASPEAVRRAISFVLKLCARAAARDATPPGRDNTDRYMDT